MHRPKAKYQTNVRKKTTLVHEGQQLLHKLCLSAKSMAMSYWQVFQFNIFIEDSTVQRV